MNYYLQLKQQQYDELVSVLNDYVYGAITLESVQRNQQGITRFKELAGKIHDWLEKGQEQRSEDSEIDDLLTGLRERDARQYTVVRSLQLDNKHLYINAYEMQAAIYQHQSETYELQRRYTGLESSTASCSEYLPYVRQELGSLKHIIDDLRDQVPHFDFYQLEGYCERLIYLLAYNLGKYTFEYMSEQLQALQASNAGLVALLDQLQRDMQVAESEAEKHKADCYSVRQSLYYQRIEKAKQDYQVSRSETACLELEGRLAEQKQVIIGLEERSASLETHVCYLKAEFEQQSRLIEKQTAESACLRTELAEQKAALSNEHQYRLAVEKYLYQVNYRQGQQNFFVSQASDALVSLRKKYNGLLKVYWAMKKSGQYQSKYSAESAEKASNLLYASNRCEEDAPADRDTAQLASNTFVLADYSYLKLSTGECSLAESDFATLYKNLSDISAQLDRLDSSYGRPLSATLGGTHSLRREREESGQEKESAKIRPGLAQIQQATVEKVTTRQQEQYLEALRQRNQMLYKQAITYAQLNTRLNKQVESLKQRLGAQ